MLDSLGFTCDAAEKAALVEFPQYGGKVVGKDIKGPLGGEVMNFPPLQEPPPECASHYWPISLQSTAPAGWSNAMGGDGTEVNVLVYKP